MTTTTIRSECIAAMRQLPEASIDAIVTDPPYGLGFMGKAWDDLPPGEEWARECLRVLKPGGHLLAFGGTRTWHRLAVAVEDAGFEIRDSLAWMHGQGFPKGKSQMKPAFEPIVMARKPFKGPMPFGLNIDACRIGDTGGTASIGEPNRLNKVYGDGMGGLKAVALNAGRWPANVILDDDQAAALDAQSGVTKSAARVGRRSGKDDNTSLGKFAGQAEVKMGHDDQGGASRFFYCAKAPKNERPKVDGIAHPTVKPLSLVRWLVRLVTPPGGTVLDPFAGSGTTLEAAILEGFSVIGIEREAEYLPLIKARIERAAKR
jgi:hypothetical protein